MTTAEIIRGDIIRTRTGKFDRIVVRVTYATPESERVAGKPYAPRDVVVHRALRDGKPFGPIKVSALGSVRKVTGR